MDEQAIRMWAWEQTKDARLPNTGVRLLTGPKRKLFHPERMMLADIIAAWVMSAKMPTQDEP